MVGAISVASKVGGLNIKEYLQLRKKKKKLRTEIAVRVIVCADPVRTWGRPMCYVTKREKKSSIAATGVGDQASNEGLTEITSGKADFQQGTRNNLQRLTYRGKTVGGERILVWRMSQYEL
jgi:hypothetical protein